jgi:hypothetical protein
MKRTYPTITTRPVDVRRVRMELTGQDKMPLDFTHDGEMQLYDAWSRYTDNPQPLGVFRVICKATTPPRPGRRSSSKTRLFAVIEGREIPLGRLAQAKAPTTNPPTA